MTGYEKDDLATALKGADLVVIPAGVPRKPGMTRDDLFNINAGIVKTLVESIAEHAPNVRCAACAACSPQDICSLVKCHTSVLSMSYCH